MEVVPLQHGQLICLRVHFWTGGCGFESLLSYMKGVKMVPEGCWPALTLKGSVGKMRYKGRENI